MSWVTMMTVWPSGVEFPSRISIAPNQAYRVRRARRPGDTAAINQHETWNFTAVHPQAPGIVVHTVSQYPGVRNSAARALVPLGAVVRPRYGTSDAWAVRSDSKW
jgi:hypothetical protein